MNDTLYLITGQSGSGKSTIANQLELTYGCKSVQSYTTRPKRYEGEKGHTFITDKELDKLTDIVAYTNYNGFRYCATAQQLDESNLYVIDIPGVEYLLEKYNNKERPITILYFDTNTKTRVLRMIDRGDSDAKIVSRLLEDGSDDWYEQLKKIYTKYNKIYNNLNIYEINANKNTQLVLEQVENIMFPFQ